MNNSTFQMMITTVAFLMFVTALTFVISSTQDIPSAFDALTPTKQTVYYQETQIPDERSVYFSGEQVVGKLYSLVVDGIPITVNSITFQNEKDRQEKQGFVVLNAKYRQLTTYNENGELVRVSYVSR